MDAKVKVLRDAGLLELWNQQKRKAIMAAVTVASVAGYVAPPGPHWHI